VSSAEGKSPHAAAAAALAERGGAMPASLGVRSDAAPGPTDIRRRGPRPWLGGDPARRVAAVAAILLALQAGLRAWVGYRGFFFLDDFAFTGRAAQHSLSDLHGYLLLPYNSHLMPGAFVEVWVLTALWPLNFAAVVTLNLVLQALVGFAFYRLLRELFGARPAILVPFAVFLFTPITLPAFLWWAAALNQLPQQLAMITALWCHTRYLRTGRVRVGVLGAVATMGGLLFSEKTILTVPLVAGFTLLWFADGSLPRRVLTAWRAHWRVWLAYLAVSLPYAAYYLLEVPSPGRPPASGNDIVQLFGSSFGHALDPGLLGGPWSWRQIGFAGALADPGKLSTYVAGVTVVGFVAASIAWHRRAVYGWLMALGYTVLTLALLAVSRATFIGPFIGNEYRYVTDVAVVAVLGATLAVLRPVGTWITPPLLLEQRSWPNRFTGTQVIRDVRDVLPRVRPAVLVAVAVAAFVASAATSTVRYDRYWSINPARPYVATLRSSLALAPRGVVVYDQEVPAEVAWALLNPYNLLSNLVGPLPDGPRFLKLGQSAASLAITDSKGHLRRTAIVGMAAIPGPVRNGCGWLLGSEPVQIPLVQRTFSWTWVLRMTYIASADTTATMHAGATTATVSLSRGLHEIYVEVAGAIDTVDFSPLSGDATVCTSDLSIGRPEPLDGTAP
jgi:hypothetical protein